MIIVNEYLSTYSKFAFLLVCDWNTNEFDKPK